MPVELLHAPVYGNLMGFDWCPGVLLNQIWMKMTGFRYSVFPVMAFRLFLVANRTGKRKCFFDKTGPEKENAFFVWRTGDWTFESIKALTRSPLHVFGITFQEFAISTFILHAYICGILVDGFGRGDFWLSFLGGWRNRITTLPTFIWTSNSFPFRLFDM